MVAIANLTIIEQIGKNILIIRSQRVLLDAELAKIYGVTTKHLNQQVKRNLDRFPEDFMFQLTEAEEQSLRSQIVTSKIGRGGRRYRPYAFTEHGALMLGNVLTSSIAISVSIQVVRAFINLRQLTLTNDELSRKLNNLENKYDANFKVVFDAIRAIMTWDTSR